MLALLLLAAAPVFASDEDVAKGLDNLQAIHQLAQVAELSVTSGIVPPGVPNDPWGTPYRFTVDKDGYLIASAGSDRKFDESVWSKVEQFSGLEGDLVLANGKVARSNRNWLYPQVTDATRDKLNALVRAEVHLMMARHPVMRALETRRATAFLIENRGAALEKDAWGTPVRVIRNGEKVRIVSAGADKTFDEASWDKPAAANLGEDMVFENGTQLRPIDDGAVLRAEKPRADAIPQPPDPPSGPDWPMITNGITNPVPVQRTEPVYPDIYRRAGVQGIVILDLAISETGQPVNLRVIKSLAPELDMSAVTAVRQWTFVPAKKEGNPIAVTFRLTINFKLN